jgi:hypothetical protein
LSNSNSRLINTPEGQIRRFKFKNLSGEDIPPYAVMMLVHEEFKPTDNLTEQWAQYRKVSFGDDGDSQSMLFCAKPNAAAATMQDSFRFAFNGPTTVTKDGFGYCTWEEYPAKIRAIYSDSFSSLQVQAGQWEAYQSYYNWGAFKGVAGPNFAAGTFAVPNRDKDDFFHMTGDFVDSNPVWSGFGRAQENRMIEVSGNQWIFNAPGHYLIETLADITVEGQDLRVVVKADFETEGGEVNRANISNPSWTINLRDANGAVIADMNNEEREEAEQPWKLERSNMHFFEYFDIVKPPVKVTFDCTPGSFTGNWAITTRRNDRSGFYVRTFPFTLQPAFWYGYWASWGWFEFGMADGGINWSVRRSRG